MVQALAHSCTAGSPGEEKLSLSHLLEVEGTLSCGRYSHDRSSSDRTMASSATLCSVYFISFQECLSQSEFEFWFG